MKEIESSTLEMNENIGYVKRIFKKRIVRCLESLLAEKLENHE
jgi:hypothetical protein